MTVPQREPQPEPQLEPLPPHKEVALAFSGGGYRAAAYHLGALSYLHSLGWRDRITHLSTVSGGTFVGAAYACSLVDREPFQGFAERFYSFLGGAHLVELALQRLGRREPGVPSGREDLIVSMARVYAETFMADPQGNPRLFGAILEGHMPLREVIFNATEFRRGIAFRFQRSASPNARIGNFYFNVPKEVAATIQLADIVAASSCFPGGFEPLAFPSDFVWPGGALPALPPSFKDPVPLMDGGVYDNQGLSSLMDADERDDSDLGLVIVSDVDQSSDSLYGMPEPIRVSYLGGLRLAWISLAMIPLMLACFASVGALIYLWRKQGAGGVADLVAYALPMVLAALTGLALFSLRGGVKSALKSVPQSEGASWEQLKRLTVDQVANMLNLRATSLLALATSVFMKRIRQLVNDKAYGRDSYKGKLVANYVYSLQSPAKFDPRLVENGVLPPSQPLQGVIDAAAKMPTTLWFDPQKPYQLPSLVAAGQAGLIHKLMLWVIAHGGGPTGEHAQLWQRLTEDWAVLLEDPYAKLPVPAGEKAPPLPPLGAVAPG